MIGLGLFFDKDDFTDFDEAIQLAAEHNIMCAWSNESFELWLLLHFRDVSKWTGRGELIDSLETAIREELHKSDSTALYDYSKGDGEIYSLVSSLGSEEEAIARAEALKKRFENVGNPSKQNPCTHVDELVLELRNPEMTAERIKESGKFGACSSNA